MQESFGAFYRIEQLILSTTPKAASQCTAQSGLPAIVTDENIKLLFRMQAEVDALEVSVGNSNATATLQHVCYKPFGDACATQSILQVLQDSPITVLPNTSLLCVYSDSTISIKMPVSDGDVCALCICAVLEDGCGHL